MGIKSKPSSTPQRKSKGGAAHSRGAGGRKKASAKGKEKKTVVVKKVKQPKARVTRHLKKLEPQAIETIKKSIFMRGPKTSEAISGLLKDLYALKKPDGKLLSRKNPIHAFDDASSVEFLTTKNDCSLFAIGSHTKKRPNNLVMGRTYDGHIFDMVEFGVDQIKGLDDFRGEQKKAVGSKPMFLFQGDVWEHNENMGTVKTLLLDFFRGHQVSELALTGLDHVIVCSAPDTAALNEGAAAAAAAASEEVPALIHFRTYHVSFKKSGTKVPRVELSPMGPSFDLTMRRHALASADLRSLASKKAKGLVEKKRKNVTRNEVGDKLGRIHLGRQDLNTMQFRKTKALRPAKKGSAAAAPAAAAAGPSVAAP